MRTLSGSRFVSYQGQIYQRLNTGSSSFAKVRFTIVKAQMAYPLNSAKAHIRWTGTKVFTLISEDINK